MSDTKQLEALRDAAKNEADFQGPRAGDDAYRLYYSARQIESVCNAALAALATEPVVVRQGDTLVMYGDGHVEVKPAPSPACSWT